MKSTPKIICKQSRLAYIGSYYHPPRYRIKCNKRNHRSYRSYRSYRSRVEANNHQHGSTPLFSFLRNHRYTCQLPRNHSFRMMIVQEKHNSGRIVNVSGIENEKRKRKKGNRHCGVERVNCLQRKSFGRVSSLVQFATPSIFRHYPLFFSVHIQVLEPGIVSTNNISTKHLAEPRHEKYQAGISVTRSSQDLLNNGSIRSKEGNRRLVNRQRCR